MKNFKKFRFTLYFFSFVAGVLAFLPEVYASVTRPTGSLRVSNQYDSSMTRFSDVNVFLTSLVDFALQFVGIVAIAAIIYGGFLMLTSGGEEEQHKKGLHVIMYSVIGIVVILGSYAIINTISAFGTGTEGTEPDVEIEETEVGSFSSGSDDDGKIRAAINPTITAGTVPMKVSFTTTGSYNNITTPIRYSDTDDELPHNPPFPDADYINYLGSDYYWKLGDDSSILGYLGANDFIPTLDLKGNKMTVVVKTELKNKYNTSEFCDTKTLCLDIENALFKKKIDIANTYYNTLKGLSDGQDIMLTPFQKSIITQAQLDISDKSDWIRAGYYPVLLYGRKIVYKENNGLEKVKGDDPTAGDTVIELLDPGLGVAATFANPYGMNLGSEHEHIYAKGGNFSPTVYIVHDNGTPFAPNDDLKAYKSVRIKASYDNIDPNRIPPNAAFVYQPTRNPDGTITVVFNNMSLTDQGTSIAEMLTDGRNILDNDPDLDTDNDGDTTNDNDIFYFEWDFDIKEDSNGDGNPANDSDWVSTDGIAYKISDTNTIDDYKKENNNEGNGAVMTSAVHIYPKNTKKIQAKLMVKNIQTQDYDNIVREIIIPEIGEETLSSVTSLFAYNLEPGTKKVTFENKSLGYYGENINANDNKIGIATATINDINLPPTKYSFEWDFDIQEEITKLGIQNSSADPITSHSYSQDGIKDNDLNSENSALDKKMIVHFPEDGKMYKVKLTTFQLKDNGSKSEIYDERVIDIFVPTVPDPIPPIAAFTWTEEDNKLSFKNKSTYYSSESKSFEDIITNDVFDLYFDYDINVDSDGDGIRDNDNDEVLSADNNNIATSFTPDTTIFDDFKDHKTKLTVKYKDSDIFDSVVRTISKNKEKSHTPIASFSYSYIPGIEDISTTVFFKNTTTIPYNSGSTSTSVIWDFDTTVDSDNDGDPANDDDSKNSANAPCEYDYDDSKQVYKCTYKNSGAYSVKITVENNPYGIKNSFKRVINIINTPSPDDTVDPIAAFVWTEENNKLSFSNTSTYYSFESESFELIINNDDFDMYFDYDVTIDTNGDGVTDNDNDIDLNIFDDYKTHRVKLTVKDLTTGRSDTVVQSVKKTNPEQTITADFIYSYVPAEFGKPTDVFFKNTSYPQSAISTVIWDFDLNTDSDQNGDPADDDDTKDNNTNSPCTYDAPKCTYEKVGNYPIKITIISKSGYVDSYRGTIKLKNKPKPPSLQASNPIAAFIFIQNKDKDKEVKYSNKAIGSDGAAISPENIIWDFDLSYDSDGDGNSGNDSDKDGDANDSFSVSKNNDTIDVTYKKYKKYNVKQTAKDNALSDSVIREIDLGPILDPLPPLPLFAYQKNNGVVTFINKSSTGEGITIKPSEVCSEAEDPVDQNCYKFEWYFDTPEAGIGSTSPDFVGYGQNLQYRYDDNDFKTHEAVLSLVDPNGSRAKMTRIIRIESDSTSDLIRANIIATPKSGNAPLTVLFSSEGSRDENGSIKEKEGIFWDLDGDGKPDPGNEGLTNTTYTYDTPGHYQVRLAVQGPSGKAIAFTWIDVYGEPPSPTIVFEDESIRDDLSDVYIGYVNTKLEFEAIIENPGDGAEGFSYVWNFDDPNVEAPSNTSNSLFTNYTYQNTGLYDLEFEVKNNTTNLSGKTKRLIKILPAPPQALIIAKDPYDTLISTENQKFYADALDVSTGRLDVIFDASESVGAKKVAECTLDCDLTKLTKFEWDFGDGESTTELNLQTPVSHTFTKPGTYDVILTVTDEENAEDQAVKKVFIADSRKPVPVIKITPTHDKTGKMITFDATGSHSSNGRITNYEWEIKKTDALEGEVGVKMFGKISRKVFNSPGVYNVELTIRDLIGEETHVTVDESLTIESQPPVARLTFEQADPEIPNQFLFNATDSFDNDPGDTDFRFKWDFGDGTTNDSVDNDGIASHTYGTKGQYRANVTVYDGFGLSDTAEVTVRVDSLLRAKIENISPRAGKAPLEVQFSGIGGYDRGNNTIDDATISAYEWDFKDGTIITRSPDENDAKTPTHTFMKKGKYDVTLTVYDSSDESASHSYTIYVGSSDPAPIAIIERGSYEGFRRVPMLFNGFTSLTSSEVPDNDDGVQELDYYWDFGDDTPIETDPEPQHTYIDTGSYTVTLTVTDRNTLQSDKDTTRVKITTARPHARFTASPSYGQSPLLIEFDASASTDPDNNIYQYLWKFGSSTTIVTTEDKIVYPFTNTSIRPMTYNVVLKVVDEDDLYDTYTLPITVLPSE